MNDDAPHDNQAHMLGWFRGLFRDEGRVPPLMVRARMATSSPNVVSVEAIWYPSGVRRAYRAKDAQGLCMLPWMKSADRVSLRVHAEGAVAALEVGIDDARAGRAIDLALG